MPAQAEVPAMDLQGYLRVVWRRKLTIILTTLVVVGGAIALSLLQTPVYEATAKILIAPRLSEQLLTNAPNQPQGGSLETDIQILTSRSTREAAREECGHAPDVSIAPVGSSQVVAIQARSTDADRAADDANCYANAYIELRRGRLIEEYGATTEELQVRIAELEEERAAVEAELAASGGVNETLENDLQSIDARVDAYEEQLDRVEAESGLSEQGGGAEVISEAVAPSSPVSPQPIRNGIAGLGIGLVLGIGLAFLREYLDDTVRNEDDFVRVTGLTVVGRIPLVTGWKDRKTPMLISATNPKSPAAEAYRTLRTNIQFLDLEEPIRSLQVTSANAVEGKTTTLANLAITMAKTGARIVVVCCDLRRPRLHEFFGLTHEVGFTSVLLGEVPLSQALQPVDPDGRLQVLASGPPPPNPSELLASKRAAELFDLMVGRADMLLVDSPPVLPVTDALVISGLVDATIVVGTVDATAKRGLHHAVNALHQVDAPLVGGVLNGISISEAYGSAYAYGYAYGPSEESAPSGRSNGAKSSRRVPTGSRRG